ncbi:hypothetical protein B0I35DRAFT_414604 [Stachybotrys elegans]|uniref:Uncharacterized protein n=1 Tax=Stachybotrys elegans TaxID=80388 RepID=A0A8K0WJS0_9HYPO|nr:hypothetical protein B0I35DRAFT_414604 [Stachybotrys elegans]
MSTAIQEALPIRALIRGRSVGSLGRTGGITHRSKDGQASVIQKAYENAGGLSYEDTAYVECHGTGTPQMANASSTMFTTYYLTIPSLVYMEEISRIVVAADADNVKSKLLERSGTACAVSFSSIEFSELPSTLWTVCDKASLAIQSGDLSIYSRGIIALVELLRSWMVIPSAVVGHSSGEIAAAYASRRITASVAIVTAYIRGRVVARNSREGRMLAVGVDAVLKISDNLASLRVINRLVKSGGNAYH